MKNAIAWTLSTLLCGLTSAQGVGLDAAPSSSPGRVSELRLKATRMSVDWDQVPLKEAIHQVRRRAGENLVLGRAIRDRVDEPVDLILRDVTALTILKLLQQQYDVRVVRRHGVLLVTSPEDALRGQMALRVHQVRLILYTPPDFPPAVRLGITAGPPRPLDATDERPEPRMTPDALVELVRQNTGGERVWEVPGASIEHHGGNLLVRHGPAVQRRVARLLVRLR